MQTVLKNKWLNAEMLLILVWMIGLFYSRALLSITSVAFIFFLWKKKHDKLLFKQYIIGCVLILLPVLLSGMWSHDKTQWWQMVEVKLPLITIGVGVLSMNLNRQQIKITIWLLLIFVLINCGWSVYTYLIDKVAINQSYLVAKVMPVPFDDDHIRFSWLVVLSMLLMVGQLIIHATKIEKIVGGIIITLLIFYLHFLAAKTGLLCLYVSIFFIFLYAIIYTSKKWIALIVLFVLIFSAAVSYKIFPSLRNRIQYVVWDFSQYANGNFLQGSSDGDRVLSMQAGLSITKKNPYIGVGFGDLKMAVNAWHNVHHPQSLESDRFIPTNEFLIYSAGSGFVGLLLFFVGLFFLLKPLINVNPFAICFAFILLIPLITDDSLEGQLGVAILSFCLAVGIRLLKNSTAST